MPSPPASVPGMAALMQSPLSARPGPAVLCKASERRRVPGTPCHGAGRCSAPWLFGAAAIWSRNRSGGCWRRAASSGQVSGAAAPGTRTLRCRPATLRLRKDRGLLPGIRPDQPATGKGRRASSGDNKTSMLLLNPESAARPSQTSIKRMKRFELSTLSLARRCSTTELHPHGALKAP